MLITITIETYREQAFDELREEMALKVTQVDDYGRPYVDSVRITEQRYDGTAARRHWNLARPAQNPN